MLVGNIHILCSQYDKKFIWTIEYSPNFSKLTDEFVDEDFKLSHNATFRVGYNTKSSIIPTVGIGFLNTGEKESKNFASSSGIKKIEFYHSNNYLTIPLGVKINFNKFFILPEVGIAINLSNKFTQIIEFVNGSKDKKTKDELLNSGNFNKMSFPFSLSIGKNFTIDNHSFSAGLKCYYGLNKVISEVPRNNHYYGVGMVLALNF